VKSNLSHGQRLLEQSALNDFWSWGDSRNRQWLLLEWRGKWSRKQKCVSFAQFFRRWYFPSWSNEVMGLSAFWFWDFRSVWWAGPLYIVGTLPKHSLFDLGTRNRWWPYHNPDLLWGWAISIWSFLSWSIFSWDQLFWSSAFSSPWLSSSNL